MAKLNKPLKRTIANMLQTLQWNRKGRSTNKLILNPALHSFQNPIKMQPEKRITDQHFY
jgi:hypothetical protein